MDEKCVNCKYFKHGEIIGRCRFYPPLQPIFNNASYFPRASSNSWCGQFVVNKNKEKFQHNSIEDVELTRRSYNCLRAVEIKTIGDLVKYHSTRNILYIPGLGKKSYTEICETVKNQFGIIL